MQRNEIINEFENCLNEIDKEMETLCGEDAAKMIKKKIGVFKSNTKKKLSKAKVKKTLKDLQGTLQTFQDKCVIAINSEFTETLNEFKETAKIAETSPDDLIAVHISDRLIQGAIKVR